jgi:hypothetical protein
VFVGITVLVPSILLPVWEGGGQVEAGHRTWWIAFALVTGFRDRCWRER